MLSPSWLQSLVNIFIDDDLVSIFSMIDNLKKIKKKKQSVPVKLTLIKAHGFIVRGNKYFFQPNCMSSKSINCQSISELFQPMSNVRRTKHIFDKLICKVMDF